MGKERISTGGSITARRFEDPYNGFTSIFRLPDDTTVIMYRDEDGGSLTWPVETGPRSFFEKATQSLGIELPYAVDGFVLNSIATRLRVVDLDKQIPSIQRAEMQIPQGHINWFPSSLSKHK